MAKCLKAFLFTGLVCFFIFTYAHEFSQNDLDFLANLNFKSLPRQFQVIIRKQLRLGLMERSFCCKNGADMVVKNIQITKTELVFQKTSTEIVSGHHACGFLGTKDCKTYEVRYVEKPIYVVKTDFIPDTSACPDQHIACCMNYINVTGSCIHKDGINTDFVDALKELSGAGLLG